MSAVAEPTSSLSRTPTQFISRTHGSDSSVSTDKAGQSAGHLPPSPTDLILTRCGGWLSLMRILIVQFEDQTQLEKHMAQAHTKTVRDWVSAPSHERDAAFKTSEQIQELMKNLRETSGKLASEHEAVYKVLSTQTLPALKGMEKEVHNRMTGMIADEKDRKKEKERDEQKLRHLIKELKAALIAAKGTGEVSPWTAGDPWITNIAIKKHSAEAALRSDNETTTIDGLETTFGVWEKNIIKNMKSALLAYTALTSVSASSHGATELLEQALQKLEPQHEWDIYRNKELAGSFDSTGQIAGAGVDDYSGATDPLVGLVKEGPLLRKSKIMKKWHENWYCLTAAGWLHEFPERPSFQPDGGPAHPQPNKSLWLKSCYISDLGGQDCGSGSEFHITHVNTSAKLSKGKTVLKFSSNSLSESESWFRAISQFVPVENGSKHGMPVTSTANVASAMPVAGGAAAEARRLSSVSTASDFSVDDQPARKESYVAPAAEGATAILPEAQHRDEPTSQEHLAQPVAPPRRLSPIRTEAAIPRSSDMAPPVPAPQQTVPAPAVHSGEASPSAASPAPIAPSAHFEQPSHRAAVPAPARPSAHFEETPPIPSHSPAALAHDTPAAPVAHNAGENPASVGPMQTSPTNEPVTQEPPKKSGNIFKRAFGSK